MSRDDTAHPHLATSLLKVCVRAEVFACLRKWADRKGAHMAQGCRDLVGKCKTKKINVFVSTHVSEREYRHCRLVGQSALGMISTALPPRNRGTTDHHKDNGDSNRDKLGAAGNLLARASRCSGTCFTF